MRALSAYLSFLGPFASSVAPLTLESLRRLRLHQAPADYVHLAFASMASALKVTTEPLEPLLPLMEELWRHEELLPYCLQILALLLDLGARQQIYEELLPKLLEPELWQAQ